MRHAAEHPVGQAIDGVTEYIDADHEPSGYRVGRGGVTLIEACTKSGLHADMPYVRVWADKVCLAEFCQHNIVGVYFAAPAPAAPTGNPVRYVCPDESLPSHDVFSCIHCMPF